MFYTILGTEDITQYFMVDRETGDVSLKQSLADDPEGQENYNVSILMKPTSRHSPNHTNTKIPEVMTVQMV